MELVQRTDLDEELLTATVREPVFVFNSATTFSYEHEVFVCMVVGSH